MGAVLLNPFMVQASGGASVPPAPTISAVNVTSIDIDYNGASIDFSFADNGGSALTSVEVQIDTLGVINGPTFGGPAVYAGGPLAWTAQQVVINTADGIPIGSHNARARGTNSSGTGAWSSNFPFTV